MTTDTNSHAHPTTQIDAAILDLQARVAKLEAAPPVTPPTGLTPTIPASIDATGKTDVAAALSAYFSALAPGSVAVMAPGAVYAVGSAIKIGGRTNIEINLQGATIRSIGSGSNENYSLFYFQTFPGTNAGIKLHDGKLVGNAPASVVTGGTGAYAAAGVLIDGGSNFELYNLTITATWGDAVEVNSAATNIYVHDCSMDMIGRNPLSVIWGSAVNFSHNTIGTTGYVVFDIEPNTSSQPCFNIAISNNVCGSWGDAFFALDGSSTGATFHDISVTNNTCSKSLLTLVTGPGRKTTLTFTGNKGSATAAASFAHVDGLKVTGNTGITVAVNDCPSAVTSPNP